jgi:hypothetical protein
MSGMERIFQGRFRVAYLLVKVAAWYAGTFFMSYHWPLFLNYVLESQSVSPLATEAILPPIAFLILGGVLGKRVLLVHLGLLMLAAPIAYLLTPSDAHVSDMVEWWVRVMLAAFVVGACFGAREQLQRHAPEV